MKRTERPAALPAVPPTVTVVVPCYNYAHYLPQAVASALDQRGVAMEVIVVDDASTDDSVQVAEGLAAADARIRLIRHETNQGHIRTYNDGLAEARGDYVVLLSADDLVAPDSLSRAAALLSAHPEVGLVYGFPEVFHEEPVLERRAAGSWSIWTGPDWLERVCARGNATIINPEAVLRTSVYRAIGPYDPEQPHTGDISMWLRAAACSGVGRVNGVTQAYYREHGGNMHRTVHAGLARVYTARRDTFGDFFQGAGAQLPGAERMRERALRAIAREALECALVTAAAGPDGEADAAELVRAARQTSPGIQRTRLWRAVAHRLDGRRPGWLGRLDRLVDTARWQWRWQRFRRFGT